MHVLLVNPPLVDVAALDLWSKPLGLLAIGAALRAIGIGVSLLDYLDVYQYGDADVRAGLRAPVHKRFGTAQYMKVAIATPPQLPPAPRLRFQRYGLSSARARELLTAMPRPDLILVTSSFTYTYLGVHDAIALLRDMFPGIPIWLGGVYAQLCGAHATAHAGADRVLAVTDIREIVQDVSRTLHCQTPTPAAWRTFCGLPAPALDLYHTLAYMPLRTSCGCTRCCAYCSTPTLYPAFEERSWQAVLAELETVLARHTIRDVAFYDDALLVNAAQRLVPLLEQVVARGWRLRFHVPNALHIHLVTPRLAALMRAAGFETIRLGLETCDEQRLRATGAKYEKDDLTSCLTALMQAGFRHEQIGAYILVGLPGQTLAEVRATIAYVRLEHGIRAKLAEYSPLPGSGLWPAAVAESRVPIADEPLWQNNSLLGSRSPVFTDEVIASLRLEASR